MATSRAPASVGGVWESFPMQATAIDEMGVVDTLDEVSRLHAVRADAEAGLFELAATFADQHSGDGLPVSRRVLPGMERAVQLGGAGTPRIAEFAYAELGARMAMSPWSAKRYVADALDVRHRLPLIWARVVAREARVGNARLVGVPDPTPHDRGRGVCGPGDGGLRGRVAALGPVRDPAGRARWSPRTRRPPPRSSRRRWPSSSRNAPGPASTAPPGSTCGPRSG